MTLDELKELMETGEEFQLEEYIQVGSKHRFKDGIIEEFNEILYTKWERSEISMNNLLVCNLVRKPWKPKVGEPYYCWSFQWKDSAIFPVYSIFEGYTLDFMFANFGNCFRTKEECESHTEIRDKLIEMRKEYV